MVQYIIRRLLTALPVFFIVTVIVYTAINLIPGDPAVVSLGRNASPENVAVFRAKWGLNKPFVLRYCIWLGNVFRGDFGRSYTSKKPVVTIIGRALPITLQLALYATLISLFIAIPIGIVAALNENGWIDLVATSGSLLGLAIPNFWLGIVLMILFAVKFQFFPPSGYVSLGEDPIDHFRHMVLPSVTLAVWMVVPLIRYLRSELIRVLKKDYIRTARMKGLTELLVVGKHAMRNSLIPFITQLGMLIGEQVGGTIVIEQVFAIPGMGRIALSAVFAREYQIVMGVVLVLAMGFILINLVVDIVYVFLDPRIRIGK
jgi:peptide/nickel transport system permease protein